MLPDFYNRHITDQDQMDMAAYPGTNAQQARFFGDFADILTDLFNEEVGRAHATMRINAGIQAILGVCEQADWTSLAQALPDATASIHNEIQAVVARLGLPAEQIIWVKPTVK